MEKKNVGKQNINVLLMKKCEKLGRTENTCTVSEKREHTQLMRK